MPFRHQINHTIDKQTAGKSRAASPSSSNFTWGQSPKPATVTGKTFNSAVGGGAGADVAEDKNMFIGLLDIFG